MIWNIKT